MSKKIASKKFTATSTGIISFSQVTSEKDIEKVKVVSQSASEKANHESPYWKEDIQLSPIYTGSDPNLAIACKKLIKKDTTTRLKGFAEVDEILKNRSNMVFQDFLPYFVFVFPKIALDNSPKARSQLVKLLSQLFAIDTVSFKPYMKSLIGVWWQLCSDPSSDVSREARNAFEQAIPKKKRTQVIMFLSHQILVHTLSSLDQKVETLSDMSSTTPEEAEDRFERVIRSSLSSIVHLIDELSDDENISLINRNRGLSDELIGYDQVLSGKAWSKAKSKNPRIRVEVYRLLGLVSKRFTKYLSYLMETKSSAFNINKLCSIVNVMIVEEDVEDILPDMFVSVITFLNCLNSFENRYNWWNTITLCSVLAKYQSLLNDKSVTMRQESLSYFSSILAVYPSDVISWFPTPLNNSSVLEPKTIVFNILTSEFSKVKDSIDSSFISDTLSCLLECSAVLMLRNSQRESTEANSFTDFQLSVLTLVENIITEGIIFAAKTNSQNVLKKQSDNKTNLNFLNTLKAVVTQFHRGSLRSVLLSSQDWETYLWKPLTSKIIILLVQGQEELCNFTSLDDLKLSDFVSVTERFTLSVSGVASVLSALSNSAFASSDTETSGLKTLINFLCVWLNDLISSLGKWVNQIYNSNIKIMLISEGEYLKLVSAILQLLVYSQIELELLHHSNSNEYNGLLTIFGEWFSYVLSLLSELSIAPDFEGCSVKHGSRIIIKNQIFKLFSCFGKSSPYLQNYPYFKQSLQNIITSCKRGAYFECYNVIFQENIHKIFTEDTHIQEFSSQLLQIMLLILSLSDKSATDDQSETRVLKQVIAVTNSTDTFLFVFRASKYLSFVGRGDDLFKIISALNLETASNTILWATVNVFASIKESPHNFDAATYAFTSKLLCKVFLSIDSDELKLPYGDNTILLTWDHIVFRILLRLPIDFLNLLIEEIISDVRILPVKSSQVIKLLVTINILTEKNVCLKYSLQDILPFLGFHRDAWINHQKNIKLGIDSKYNEVIFFVDDVCHISKYLEDNSSTWRLLISGDALLHGLGADNYVLALELIENISTTCIQGSLSMTSLSYMKEIILSSICCLPEEVRQSFIIPIVDIITRRLAAEKISPACCEHILSECLAEKFTVNNIFTCFTWENEQNGLKRNFKTPSAVSTLSLGQNIWYIKSLPTSLGTYHDSYNFEVVPCVVSGIHRESGSLPYYSVSLPIVDKYGTVIGQRELQTEWHRLIIEHNVEILSSVLAVQDKAMLTVLYNQILKIINEIKAFALNVANNSNIIDSEEFNLKISVLSKLLIVSNQLSSDLYATLIMLGINIMKISATAYNADNGMILFKASIDILLYTLTYCYQQSRSDILWLPTCFQILSGSNSPLFKLLNCGSNVVSYCTNESYIQLLEALNRFLALLMSLIQWQYAISYSGDILSVSVILLQQIIQGHQINSTSSLDLNPLDSKFLHSSLSCLLVLWKSNDIASGEIGFRSWENAGLELCLQLIVDDYHSQSAVKAGYALHWFIQGRSRKQILVILEKIFGSNSSLHNSLLNVTANIISELDEQRFIDPQFHSITFFSVLTKILEIFSLSRMSIISHQQVQEILTLDKSQNSEDIFNSELLEAEEETNLFRSVVGSDLFTLTNKFCNLLPPMTSTLTRAGSTSSQNLDEFEEEIESDEDQFSFDRETSILLLLWLLTLQKIDTASTLPKIDSSLHSAPAINIRARCGSYLRQSGLATKVLNSVISALGNISSKLDSCWNDLSTFLYSLKFVPLTLHKDTRNLAACALFKTVHVLPALVRNFWMEQSSRFKKDNISKFIVQYVRTSLVSREMKLIQAATSNGIWKDDEISARGSVQTGEVIATLVHDEAKIEIKIKLPLDYPLKNVEVEGLTRMGVDESRWRQWVLQIVRLLSLSDGTLVDAVTLWKNNLKSELEGGEPCPICYSTLHPKTLALPAMSCPTCKNKFHSVCLSQWFKSSGKSDCVLCRQPFITKKGQSL